MVAVVVVFCGVLGLAIGSFLTVVTYRVPRHQSIVAPGSRCPACQTPLAWRDNVPVVSWLVLQGRCRTCRAAISPRYPALEATTAAVFAMAAVVVGPTAALVPVLVLAPVVLGAGVVLLESRK